MDLAAARSQQALAVPAVSGHADNGDDAGVPIKGASPPCKSGWPPSITRPVT